MNKSAVKSDISQSKSLESNNLVGRYTREEVIGIVRENKKDIGLMCNKYSKNELDAMHYAIYKSKPLTKHNKKG